MAGLDETVLARRQKDLDNYTEQYKKTLEKRARMTLSSLSTKYKILGSKIQAKVKALYDEIGATEDPRKLNALIRQADRLETLAAQIAQDIKNCDKQLQPFYTGVLAHEYRQAYYFTAFGLEQVREVAAAVPVLTQSHVLGVLINPWLTDGLTYAQRLSINMATFASKMKDTIYDAVTLGKGWNETARDIMEKTGEGYFNAVRLARTELNRASAMGASYCYMQNSDILDGKQWDATLDNRTVPRDAANDGKVYDLDYDTIDRPGVPGQRIPNHPQCRCTWRPIFSATGMDEKRIRIARDNTDTPAYFGGRVYTEAKTYREYAKARGLPDLDDQLAYDKLNRYLRPGETQAEFNKTVARYQYKGKEITVPKPYWDEIPKLPGRIIPINPTDAPPVAEGKTRRQVIEETWNNDKLFSGNTDAAAVWCDTMEKAPEEYYKFALQHFNKGVSVIEKDNTGHGVSHYMPSARAVRLDNGDWANVKFEPGKPHLQRRAKGTLAHEVGHGLDYGLGKELYGNMYTPISTMDKGYTYAVDRAIEDFKERYATSVNTGWQRTIKDPKKIAARTKELEDARASIKAMREDVDKFWAAKYEDGKFINRPEYAGLGDIFDALTGKHINNGYGHSAGYWERSGAAQKEIFANLFELHAHNETEAIDVIEKHFPEVIKSFRAIIRKHIK